MRRPSSESRNPEGGDWIPVRGLRPPYRVRGRLARNDGLPQVPDLGLDRRRSEDIFPDLTDAPLLINHHFSNIKRSRVAEETNDLDFFLLIFSRCELA